MNTSDSDILEAAKALARETGAGEPARLREGDHDLRDVLRVCGTKLLERERSEARLESHLEELRQALWGYTRVKRRISKENRELRAAMDPALRPIIGAEAGLRDVVALVERVVDTPISVLITGETGTGKEVIARYLHAHGPQADGPFVAINCAALPEGILESELFGIEKGVATGVGARAGKFEEADGGTLLLDEIADMPWSVQAKILRVLQEREVVRIGGSRSRPFNVRIISATNRDLQTAIAEGAFREDLYYRIVGFHLHLPPLRERAEDLADLVAHFLAEASVRFGRPASGVSPEAMRTLEAYPWPGNVRELRAEVERAVALATAKTVELSDLSPKIAGTTGAGRAGAMASSPRPGISVSLDAEVMSLREARLRFEREYVSRVLSRVDGSRREVAALLGLSREGLRKKLHALGLSGENANGA